MSAFKKCPVRVLSVKTFVDRQKSIVVQGAKFGFEPQFIFDFDVPDLTDSDRLKVAGDCLPDPTISLLLKHFHALKLIAEGDSDFGLVLEDDALLFDDFAAAFEEVLNLAGFIKPGWLIFLGGADNKIDSRFLESGGRQSLVESPITTAEAYIVDKASARARVRWAEDNILGLPADHMLKSLDATLSITQYRVSIPLCTQGSITGRFETALDGSRKKHSSTYLRIRYEYNKFRRQTLPRLMSRLRAGQ